MRTGTKLLFARTEEDFKEKKRLSKQRINCLSNANLQELCTAVRRYKCEVQGAREKGYLPIPQQQLLINVLQQTPVGRNYQNYKLIRKIKSIGNKYNGSGLYETEFRTERKKKIELLCYGETGIFIGGRIEIFQNRTTEYYVVKKKKKRIKSMNNFNFRTNRTTSQIISL